MKSFAISYSQRLGFNSKHGDKLLDFTMPRYKIEQAKAETLQKERELGAMLRFQRDLEGRYP